MPYPETVEYIKKQLKEHIKPEQIRNALEDAGYQQDVIDELLKEAGAVEPAQKQSSGIEKMLLKDICIGMILIAVVGTLIHLDFFSGSAPQLFSPNSDSTFALDFGKSS